MTLSRHPVYRFAAFVIVAVSLGKSGFLIGCSESDASANAETRSPAAADIELHTAIMQGDDHVVYAHIVAGTPVDTRSMMGDTPLHIAAAMGRSYATEVLIGAAAYLEAVNSSGVTPLFNAAFFCHADVLQKLIDAGADTSTTDQTGTPILQIMEMPWEQIRPIYEMVHSSIGMPFDEKRIRDARVHIAEMLR